MICRIGKSLAEIENFLKGKIYTRNGITPETGQWRWKMSRTYDAVENYCILINYIKSYGVAETDITDGYIDTYYSQYIQENSILSHKDFELVRLSKNGKPEHYIPATENILLSEKLDRY